MTAKKIVVFFRDGTEVKRLPYDKKIVKEYEKNEDLARENNIEISVKAAIKRNVPGKKERLGRRHGRLEYAMESILISTALSGASTGITWAAVLPLYMLLPGSSIETYLLIFLACFISLDVIILIGSNIDDVLLRIRRRP